MSDDVIFEDEQEFMATPAQPKRKGLVEIVVSTGLAKTEREALTIICAVLVICACISGYFLFKVAAGTGTPKSPYVNGQSALLPPKGK